MGVICPSKELIPNLLKQRLGSQNGAASQRKDAHAHANDMHLKADQIGVPHWTLAS